MTSFFMSDMNPIYIVRRRGDVADPYVSITETIKVGIAGEIILKEIPSRFERVSAKNSSDVPLFEKQSDINLASNEFYVDYTLGIVTIGENNADTFITFTYMGTGVISIGASRIYVEDDGSNPIQSLKDLIESGGIGVGENYTHPIGDGNLHVPSTGTTNNGKILKAGSSAGSISWGNISITELSNLSITNPLTNHVISYNGTQWINSSLTSATTSVAGIVQLTSATNSTSTTLGANALAVKTAWDLANSKASTSVVTTTANGLMDFNDKVKLNGIATGANNYVHPASHPPSIIAQDATNRFMTDTEKTKLAGIAVNANNYVHPSTHPASMITQDSNNRFVTDIQISAWNAGTGGGGSYVHPEFHPPSIITQDASNRFVTDVEKTAWNAKASTSVVTTTVNGLMSFDDKVKLNGVATGANNYVHPANHPASIITQDASNRFVTDVKIADWDAKETTTGSQNKATQALTDANTYTDIHANNTAIHRNITTGTTDPTGGVNGDIYFQYE